ncbi:MAG: tail fiber domain-containing protein, partial [Bacteroidetes bacterium]|nr:tail fiber domain-containing protein [Bacteroidota bacterium]
ITTGTLSSSLLDADLQDLADGTLSDSKLEATIDRTNFIASGYVQAPKFVDDDANYYADLNTGGKLGGIWGINTRYSNSAFNISSNLANLLNVEDGASNTKLQVTPAGVWASYFSQGSSIRWKKDVKPLKNSLTNLMKLQGVSYLLKEAENGAMRKIGFIAEEVGKVFPELVNYEENGVDARGLEYAQITAVLVEAVKELKAELDAKDAQINELIKRVEALEKR